MARRPPAALPPRAAASRTRKTPGAQPDARPPGRLGLTFARNLRAARGDSGLTQAELGDRAGLSRYYISQIETGGANVTLDVVEALASVLGLRPIELLTPLPGRKQR